MAGAIRFAGGRLNVGEVRTPRVIQAVKKQASPKGVTIVDAPPGTACPAVEAVKGIDHVILVTEPTPFGMHDLTIAVRMLRELLTVFSGNELDIGITLAVWLVCVGMGSFGGARISAGGGLGLSFLLVAVLAGPTLTVIWLIRPALGLELGETVSLGTTMLSTLAVLFPVSLVRRRGIPIGGDQGVQNNVPTTSDLFESVTEGKFVA